MNFDPGTGPYKKIIYKFKNITNIVTYDFTGLFNSINLNDLNHNINLMFKKISF